MTELLSQFDHGIDTVRESPVVQGLAFESKFLQDSQLNDLHVKGINRDGIKDFYFPIFPHARLQENGAVTKLSKGQLYHLRHGHPAIDAVCVVKVNSGVEYLVLMQVSLSRYGEHKSKSQCHIQAHSCQRKPNMSIVQYYPNMTEGIAPDNVLFVYASPKELKAPVESTFLDVLLTCETRGSPPHPPYFYGFVEGDTNAARTLQVDAEIVGNLHYIRS